MALLPPGGLPEIVFSFDTTGSMSSCLGEVRGRLQDMIQRLQADIPAIRIAVFAHGDYCDRHDYVTKYIDFSTDIKKLCSFVKNVKSTAGGDTPECYELVLRQVREELSWTPGSNRSLVMIGDAPPHEADYTDNVDNIDWREETKALADMGVRIYATQCSGSSDADNFYKTIAEKTNGRHLRLDSFSNILDFLMAICYSEHGEEFLQVYEKEVRARCGGKALHKDLDGLFTTLRDTTDDAVVSPLPVKGKIEGAKKTVTIVNTPTSKKSPKAAAVRKSKTIKRIIKKKISKPKALVLRREEVPENNFGLKNLSWTPWIKVISPDVPDSKEEALWEKRRGDHHGYRRKIIFSGQTEKPAFYEVAVQTKFRARKFVVFNKFVRKIPLGISWESRLLGRGDVRSEVNRVLKYGCNVCVRRVQFRRKAISKSTSSSLKMYDYAWRRVRKIRPNHRTVIKGDIKISDDSF